MMSAFNVAGFEMHAFRAETTSDEELGAFYPTEPDKIEAFELPDHRHCMTREMRGALERQRITPAEMGAALRLEVLRGFRKVWRLRLTKNGLPCGKKRGPDRHMEHRFWPQTTKFGLTLHSYTLYMLVLERKPEACEYYRDNFKDERFKDGMQEGTNLKLEEKWNDLPVLSPDSKMTEEE